MYMKVIFVGPLLLGSATALRAPLATRRAILGSAALSALPSQSRADSIEEIAARANAQAEEVRHGTT